MPKLSGRRHFDSIISDIPTQSTSGQHVLYALRHDEKPGTERHIPTIAMTACFMAASRQALRTTGMGGRPSGTAHDDALLQPPCKHQHMGHA